MKEHEFTLVLTADPNEDEADKMYATFNDGTISTIAGMSRSLGLRHAAPMQNRCDPAARASAASALASLQES